MRGVRLSGDCPRCGSELVVRRRRADEARFVSCSAYPECRWAGDYDGRLHELMAEIDELRRQHRASPHVDLDRELRALIKIAHPDKWQTADAKRLGHELTVALVALRERLS